MEQKIKLTTIVKYAFVIYISYAAVSVLYGAYQSISDRAKPVIGEVSRTARDISYCVGQAREYLGSNEREQNNPQPNQKPLETKVDE